MTVQVSWTTKVIRGLAAVFVFGLLLALIGVVIAVNVWLWRFIF